MSITTSVRRLAETVVSVLREPRSAQAHQSLAGFELKEWEASYHWLDANGLALYFRDTVRANQLSAHIPPKVVARLDQNFTDNQRRIKHHRVEFQTINAAFQNAGIRYANLKGFTLEPDYCPDISLRYQCDLDFIVHRGDNGVCRAVLHNLGYRVTAEKADTLEFKIREDRVPDIADLYKPRRQQSVEIHFASPARKVDLSEACL